MIYKKLKTQAAKNFRLTVCRWPILILSLPKSFLVPDKKIFTILNLSFLQKIWHRAMEQSHYQRLFALFKSETKQLSKAQEKIYQVVFCMDDREGSFRRLLEAENHHIETFGTAGFFGIDCYFQSQNQIIQKMCPGNLEPEHIIVERLNSKTKNPRGEALLELALFMSRHGANSTILGLVSAYTIGHLSLFSLLTSMLYTNKFFRAKRLVLGTGPDDLIFEQESAQA